MTKFKRTEPASGPRVREGRVRAWAERWTRGTRENLEFFRAFLRAPGRVGAVCPSSRFLARAMVAGLPLSRARLVVELGPGTGVFTRELVERSGPQTRILAVELDPGAAARLRERFPRVTVVNASAEALVELVQQAGFDLADYIISGLPWVAMPAPLQERIMQAVAETLCPGGVFTTFAYLVTRLTPPAWRYWRLLPRWFREVRVSAVEWRNVPPALVYRCVK